MRFWAKSNAIYAPNGLESAEQVLDSFDSRLFFLWKHFETKNETVVQGLGDAPAELRTLLDDHELRAPILKLLHQ